MPKKILPFVVKIGNAEDEASGDAFEIYRFRKVRGADGELKISRGFARSLEAVRALLIQKNADLLDDQDNPEEVLNVITSRPRTYYLYAARLGWRPNRSAFVPAVGEAIGPNQDPLLLRPTWLNAHMNVSLATAGTLAEWKKDVAEPASYSDAAMLVLAAAFAAPLVEVSGLQSFGINIHGKAKVGKTAALIVGASVAGIGRESQLPNWASTANATTELARVFNDTMLPANEVGLLAGRKKEAYGPIRELIYRLSEGRDKARHSSWKEASAASNAQFRTIFVSTAEHSFNEYAAYAGEKRDEGEYARCIDIAATTPDRATIMSRKPDGMKASKARRWARKSVIGLRVACEKQHGTALRPYIEYVIEQGPALPAIVERYSLTFIKRAMSMNIEGALEHAARNMALIFAGGCIAIDAKILPWKKVELKQALIRCFELSVGEIRYHETAEERAISAVVRSIKNGLKHKEIIERKKGLTLPDNVFGFYHEGVAGRTYSIQSKVFREWLGDKRQIQLAIDWLDAHRLLKPKATEKVVDRKSLDWAEQTVKGAGSKSVRSIVFLDPSEAVERWTRRSK